ncbi:SidA/IucD/PvdA family monooxygenase [Salmonella enterica]|nr:SidA/IucD/PvdA family monooxygenase [Salmonella enterica]
MSRGIIIIGSGFAARQLVKNIRKQDAHVPLTLIAADSMDEYNKPDLSHVISQSQRADDLTRQLAGEFAEQFNLRLLPHTWVADIDADAHVVKSQDKQWQYDKLVLATGATAFVPPIAGRELMLTLNSQQEYRACETQLRDAQRVLIVGGGLIGSELAMDFCRAGVAVNRGVCVDSYLQTSHPDIYAIGDCAEINGQVLPFLQPIQLSAMYLAKNLLGGNAPLKLPAMLVKVKTPELPLHLAGETQRRDLSWQITAESDGMIAKGMSGEGQLRAFVVSEDRMKEAFALLKTLSV